VKKREEEPKRVIGNGAEYYWQRVRRAALRATCRADAQRAAVPVRAMVLPAERVGTMPSGASAATLRRFM